MTTLLDPRAVLDPSAAQAVEQIETMLRRLREAADRLRDVQISAAELPARVDWQTAAARLFHTDAEDWRHSIAILVDEIEGAVEEARRVRARLMAEQEHPGW